MALGKQGRDVREEALERGEIFYFTGKPCSKGHIAERYTANQTCRECSQEQRRQAEEKRKLRRDNDPEFGKRRRAQRASSNRGYAKRNRGLKNAGWALWRAKKIRAVPKWADIREIESLYLLADRIFKETGVEYDVDHIVPLNHPLVSGLHVTENLRVITKTENLLKGSKFDP